MLGEHGYTGKNIMHAYNELAHIPLMIHLPGGSYAGNRVKFLTQNIDLMPTILSYHGCPIPNRVKGMNLLDILEGKEKEREQVIYGWFGRAVNVYDGRYTYFRAPASMDNQPLYQYCAQPSSCWRFFDERYGEKADMGRFLPYTNYPVYRFPVLGEEDYFGDLSHVAQSLLFDIEMDYEQRKPIHNEHLEQEMCAKLIAGMKEAQSPQEQFKRLGLV